MYLQGDVINGNKTRRAKFNHYPFTGFGAVPESTTTLSAPSGWHLDLVAGTNPSRPVFTPPQILQDLIELPRLLRDTGRLIRKPGALMSPKEAANAYLAAKFGWWPLIEDAMKLIELQDRVLKRTKELNDLYSGRGLRRRLKFGESNESKAGTFWVALSYPGYVGAQYDVKVEKRSWGTIRWMPTTVPKYSPGDMRQSQLARQLIFGLTPEGMAKGAWDVIPWTWLLGWFTNIGKFTLAHSNTIPAAHSRACFMSMTTETRTPKGLTLDNAFNVNCKVLGETSTVIRTRAIAAPGIPLPGFNMPFLDMSRLSVLGALFVQRLKR